MAKTKRTYDENGWLTIRDNPIAKVGVFPYRGSEILGAPDPDKIYNVLVSPDEFSKQEFLDSFDLIPIIDDHELIGGMGTSTDERPPAGVTGKAHFKHPYVLSDIKVYSDDLQNKINKGKVELSTAYTLDWVPEVGTYEGQPYEYKQVVKAANHLALVDRGRFGKDVAVLNGYAFNSGGFIPMTLEELLAAIANLSDEEKAALLAQLVPAQNEDEDKDKAENEAEDAEPEAEQAEESAEDLADAVEQVADAVEDGDQAKAEAAAEEAVDAAEEALADAEELEEKIAETAMNAAIKHIDSRNAMAAKVRPFIGSVPSVAMNSAESIAQYACKKLGVPHGKGQATIVLNAYLHGRKPVTEQAKAAMNSAPVSGDSIKTKLWGAK